MHYQSTFQRYEIKYLLTQPQKQAILRAMQPYMKLDKYGRTTNMGSLYRLTYHLTLRSAGKEKEMIDKLRCRNGNLEISVSRQETAISEM